ncbi:MAG TPA: ABC transporter permease [Candidatus Acidoferrum sp.]|nr:ABC transporter permease [Candidatus Acidoferrum sp.]
MTWLRILTLRIKGLFGRSRRESELETELRAHLEALTAENIRRGMNEQEARYAARREFGGVEQTKELYRERRGLPLLETLLQDIRFGARSLTKNPGFTIVAVLTLALGIGANVAIFSVVNAVLLRPLPYKNSDQLVTILHDGDNPVSVANYIDWRDQSRAFEAMAAADYWTPSLTGVDPPEHLWGLQVTQNLLPMLGVQPLLGRLFVPGEDQKGAEHEVILSHGLWQRRFAGERNVLGKTITLNGELFTVVGVMPTEFKFAPFWATRAELWVPDAFGDRIHNRGGNSLRIFARLKPEVTLAQARAEIATITARLEQRFPGTNRHVVVTPLMVNVVGEVKAPLLVLLGAVGFVLLIACANVAHMLMARSATRQKEIAVRAALGAPRARLIRQFFTENLLLASLGASAGLLLAVWGTRVLIAASPANIPRVETVNIDARVALFLLGVTFLTSLAFGLVPALQTTALNLSDALKESSRGSSEGNRRNRLRSFLVVSEFALALMLLIGAGLMIRSFFALQSVDPGFNPHNVLSMVVSVAGSKEADANRRALFYRELLGRVRTLPGVQAAGGINHLPLAGDQWGWPFTIEGRPKPRPGESPSGVYRLVTPGYFETMRLPLVRGRYISAADDISAPGVVIINERAARRYWRGADPIGQHVSFADDKATNSPTWLTVIGIVKDAKQEDWTAPVYPEVYLASFQNRQYLEEAGSHMAYITLVVRTTGDPGAYASTVKSAVWSLDRDLPISEVLTMDSVVSDANAQARFETILLGVFALVALVMAAVGIYGVMSYSVSRRTHEIGIRISLGASCNDVFRLVVRQGMVLALAGSAAGIAGALLLSRLMTKILYGVPPTDPATFVCVALLLAMVALLATYIPARRATRVDPLVALRYE